ncbi:MAG: hypothetical protein E7256_03795 [Lachnospiraceae bacterium]|nr:hypothetical protein [Lachnospiraceae bacterium]
MIRNTKHYKKLCLILILSIIVSSTELTEVSAASSLKLYNYTTGSNVTYTDKQITYVYNGKSISLTGTPGILSSNGVALGSFADIFGTAMGLKCTLNKTTKKVTITNGTKTLVMTVGSKTAYVDGKAVTMNTIPISVKYTAANKAVVLVPTRFVAETFGYVYNWNSSTSTVTITKAMNLFYDNKTVAYTGIKGNVTADGKAVNVSNLPSILISNTAMVQAWRVFTKTLGVTYKINNANKELTFTKGKITVKMTLGSTTAYINGQKTTCGVAPRMVKNLDNNAEVVLVPGSFLAKALGYNYTWDSATSTSKIITTKNVGVTSQIQIATPTPTAKPTAVPTAKPTAIPTAKPTAVPTATPAPTTKPDQNTQSSSYYTWSTDSSKTAEVQEAKESVTGTTTFVNDSADIGELVNVYKEVTTEKGYETYVFTLATPSESVNLKMENNQLDLTFARTLANDASYSLGGTLAKSIETVYDNASTTTSVQMSLVEEAKGYKASLSEDGLTLTVTVYTNYLTDSTGGIKTDGTKYYTFTGIDPLKPQITEDSGNVYLTFANTVNGLGDKNYSSSDDSITVQSSNTFSTTVVIKKPANYKAYQTSSDGTKFTVSFEKEATAPTPTSTPAPTAAPESKHDLSIKLPSGVAQSSVTSSDQYHNKKIVISMPGDQTSFYKSNPITTKYNTVKSIAVAYNASKKVTEITITTTKIQAYKIDFSNGSMQVTIANPSAIYKKIVVLDAGHGGTDPGTLKGTVYEKDIVFNVLNNYAKTYFDASPDIKVYYTRITDIKVDLYERAEFPTLVEADLFVSLHVNASTNSAAKGTNVYYSTLNTSKSKSGLTSKILATSLQNNLVSALGTNNRGVATGNFVVVKYTKVPAVLIELAFITNSSDYNLLVSPAFQQKSAKVIYDTLVSIFKTYPTGR